MSIKEQTYPVKITFGIPIGDDKTVERFVYSYIIRTDRVFLIDTGVAGAEKVISSTIQNLGKAVSEIDAIILTHSHPDHLGSASSIKSLSGAQVWAHKQEQVWIEDVDRQKRERPIPAFDKLVTGPVKIDRFLSDGDLLHLGDGAALTVLHTPGHSSGSISLFSEIDGVLFSGDVIPQPGGVPIYEDVSALARSLIRLSRFNNLSVLYSSWADPVYGQGAVEALRAGIQYLKTIHATVMQVDSELDSPNPMELCKQSVARLELPPFAVNPLVARSLIAHRDDAAQNSLDSIPATFFES